MSTSAEPFMTVDQVIALAASICGLFSAVAAYITAFQSKRQREASYHPELIISRESVIAETPGEARIDTLPDLWDNKPITERKESDGLSWPPFNVHLRNIGLGAAKNLKTQWSFPIEEEIEHLNQAAKQATIPLTLKFDDETFSVEHTGGRALTNFHRYDRDAEFDFLLPASLDSSGLSIRLPKLYVESVATAVFLATRTPRNFELLKIPPLHFRVEYEDIGGSSIIAETELWIDFFSLTHSPVGFSAVLESRSPRRTRKTPPTFRGLVGYFSRKSARAVS